MLQEGELNLNSVVLGGFFCIKAVNMDLGFSQKCVHARARAANRYQKKRRKKKESILGFQELDLESRL